MLYVFRPLTMNKIQGLVPKSFQSVKLDPRGVKLTKKCKIAAEKCKIGPPECKIDEKSVKLKLKSVKLDSWGVKLSPGVQNWTPHPQKVPTIRRQLLPADM